MSPVVMFEITTVISPFVPRRHCDEKPDAAVLNPLLDEFRATLRASNPAQPPEVTVYEIAADV